MKYKGKLLTLEQHQWFMRNYPKLNNEIIATYLGLTSKQVLKYASRNHIRKSDAYKTECAEYTKKKARIAEKKWRKAHPDKFRGYQKKWKDKNKDKIKEYFRNYETKNREARTLRMREYRKRKRNEDKDVI